MAGSRLAGDNVVAYFIGTDEAGYGPNLGPLIVSSTIWQVPDETIGEDLYSRLRKVITAATSEFVAPQSPRDDGRFQGSV